jgi:hypothetical protein
MPSSRSRRRPQRPPAVIRPHAPLTGIFAADLVVSFQAAVDLGFVAVDAIVDLFPQEDSLALVQRLGFCDCGRLTWTATTSPAAR